MLHIVQAVPRIAQAVLRFVQAAPPSSSSTGIWIRRLVLAAFVVDLAGLVAERKLSVLSVKRGEGGIDVLGELR